MTDSDDLYASGGETDDVEDLKIDEDIQQIMDDLTPTQRESVAISEATLRDRAKRERANEQRRVRDKKRRDEKKAEASREKERENSVNSDDGEARAKKKPKTLQKTPGSQKITVYVEIQPPPARQTLKSKAKTTEPKPTNRGPCFFTLDDSFDKFKGLVAQAIPCRLKLLPTDQMTWRYEKPANDPKKPLTSGQGYEAMLISLAERTTALVLIVSIPPPRMDDATWDTGEGDHVERPYDYYDEVSLAPPEDLSAKAQIVRFAILLVEAWLASLSRSAQSILEGRQERWMAFSFGLNKVIYVDSLLLSFLSFVG